VSDLERSFGKLYLWEWFKERTDPQQHEQEKSTRDDGSDLSLSPDHLLDGGARQRRRDGHAREKRSEYVSHSLCQELLVGIDFVVEFLGENKRHREGDTVGNYRYSKSIQ
jgi:hypothetical protein